MAADLKLHHMALSFPVIHRKKNASGSAMNGPRITGWRPQELSPLPPPMTK